MRGGMAQDVQRLGTLVGNDLQTGVVLDQKTGVHQRAIDLAGKRRLGQTGANRGGHFLHGNGMVERPLAAIG